MVPSFQKVMVRSDLFVDGGARAIRCSFASDDAGSVCRAAARGRAGNGKARVERVFSLLSGV